MNVVKESALIATRNDRNVVTYKDLSQAIERIDLGVVHRLNMTAHEREAVAFHETGHLVVLYQLHPTDDVFKASIVARGGALGVVHHQPREELHTSSREKILADIKVALGGYVAEKVRYGVTSNGVASDFQAATRMAHAMVWRLGMGTNGYVGDFSSMPENEISEHLKENLNKETYRLLSQCAKDVEELLRKEWALVERFVKELLEREELEYDDIHAIFTEYGKARSQVPIQTVHPDDAAPSASVPPPAAPAGPPPPSAS